MKTAFQTAARLLAWFLVLVPLTAHAHSMYQSSLLIDVHAHSLDLELQLPPSRLAEAAKLSVTQGDLPALQAQLAAYITPRLFVTDASGRVLRPVPVGPLRWSSIDGAPYVLASFHVSFAQAGQTRSFSVTDHVITDALPSHAVLVSVRSDWASAVFANEPDLVGILNGETSSLPIELGRGSWRRGFQSVFRLGTRHIAEGTDHLLFLLALLLPAPLGWARGRWSAPVSVRASLLRIVGIATAFTLGHSLTLALASFGLVHVPESPIEVLIAISILISAVHAMRPLFPGRESLIAGGFGLIHGLAFATTLADLGLRGWERAASILAFNLGIEAMQLFVIACVLPSLLLLSRTPAYTVFRCAVAVFAAMAATGWTAERTTGVALGVDRAVNVLAAHAAPLATVLFTASLAAFTVHRRRAAALQRGTAASPSVSASHYA